MLVCCPQTPLTSRAVMTLQTVALCIVLACILPGNVLVMVTVYLNRHFHTFHYFLLASLACCDSLTLVLVALPRLVVVWRTGEKWLLGDSWCICTTFVGKMVYITTISHLCAVSYERYKAIVKESLSYSEDLTKRRVLWSIFLHWFVTVAVGIPGSIVHAYYNYNPALFACAHDKDRLSELERAILVFAFIPQLAMIRMNYVTVKIAIRETKQILARQAGIKEATRNQEEREDGTSTLMANLKKKLIQHRAARDGLCIIGVFLNRHLPTYLVALVRLSSNVNIPPAVIKFAYVLAASNSACNPIIYSIRKRAFRRTVKRLILRRSTNSVEPLD